MRFASFALVLVACSPGSSCPSGYVQVGSACAVVDAGDDASADAAMTDAPSLPCGHTCVAPTPVCDVAHQTCVECASPSDCTAPRTMCAQGQCVQCTAATEATACGANACDPTTGQCTTTARGSLTFCEACVADSECGTGLACVPMSFMGMPRPGGYCLAPRPAAGCDLCMFLVETTPRASLSGAAPAVYCGVPEAVTSCEAVLDHHGCGLDADCGAPGLADGDCRAGSCEPLCNDSCQCQTGFGYTCQSGTCR